MQEFILDTRTCLDEQGRSHTFCYALLIEEIVAGTFACQDFGVKVEEPGGDSAQISGITPSYTRIRQLLDLLMEHTVTPSTLADVVQDWL